MDKLKIIEVRSEIAAGTRGASLGVDAIKVASLSLDSDYFQVMDSTAVRDENDILFKKNAFPYAKYIDGVSMMIHRVRDQIYEVMHNDKKFPIVLAGDHSTAAGTILGIRKARPDQRLGVIWIDAHPDIHSPYTTITGNMHGMPLAIVTGLDNIEMKINNVGQSTIDYWNRIKTSGNGQPIIDPGDIVYFGVRDIEEAEGHLIKRYNIRNFTVEEVSSMGVGEASHKAVEYLDRCDIIYVSFDVDSLDAAIAKGTGTPVMGGFTIEEAKKLNEELIKSKKVCAWEMVEVNPVLDNENMMAKMAFEILESTTNSLIKHF